MQGARWVGYPEQTGFGFKMPSTYFVKLKLFAQWLQFRSNHNLDRVAYPAPFIVCVYIVCMYEPRFQSTPVLGIARLDITKPSLVFIFYFFQLSLAKFMTIFFASLYYLSCVWNFFQTTLTPLGPIKWFPRLSRYFRVKNLSLGFQANPYLISYTPYL